MWNTRQLEFFAYQSIASVVRGLSHLHALQLVSEDCSCLCVQWPERGKGREWEVASGEVPLGGNTTFLQALGIYSSVGEQLLAEITQGMFLEELSSVWASGSYSEDFNKAIEQER